MKNVTLPQLLPECDYTHFCKTCRNKEGGREFRKQILGIREIKGVDVDFECPKDKPWEGEEPEKDVTATDQVKNAVGAAAKGTVSVVKTTILRKDRVPDDVYKDRLNTCTNCPGNHAVFKNGALHTCGKFADSITGKLPTCGCILTKKARDAKQDCPMGYWTKLTVENKEIDTK